MARSQKAGKEVGKTAWDFLEAIRPRDLKFFHYIIIGSFLSTLLAIYSGNDDGNTFFYIRVLVTKLYQDQNTIVALLIAACLLLLLIVFVLYYQIYSYYKPEIKRLETNNIANNNKQPKTTKTTKAKRADTKFT